MADVKSLTDFMNSKDHGELLDVIDLLRSQGVSRYVPLPQIIVCGDQSSGKSSVLEAISGVRFPTKDKLCTLFATELVLRRDSTTRIIVAIIPSSERTVEEKERLAAFKAPTSDLGDFPKLVDAAKEAMGISPDTHLTLVDLPGLFHSEIKQQSSNDKDLVRDLVLRYMASPRSVILAVVSAQYEFVNQIVTHMARDIDKNGDRTLGIITKPDTLPRTSESEESFVNIAKNEGVNFRLGWHVLRNRDYETKDCSLEERNKLEMVFFSQGIWTSLPASSLGVETLKARLSIVLTNQILSELPSLLHDVKIGIDDCTRRLAKLGVARGTPQEQRFYMTHVGQSFSNLAKAATDGTYIHEFFGDAGSDIGYSRRLRAVVQNQLIGFAEDMRCRGHYRKVVEDGQEVDQTARPTQILRSEYIEHVRRLMRRSRGQELPGTFNPLIVGDLFYEQAQSWPKVVNDRYDMLMAAIKATLAQILQYTTDETTREGLLRDIINPAMDRHSKELEAKMSEVLRPHIKGHPITYNHTFIETIQRIQHERNEKSLRERLNRFFRLPVEQADTFVHERLSTGNLLKALVPSKEDDMDRHACSLAVDCMEAYYQVALKMFVDSFAVLAMEYCLIDGLSEVFSPATVMQMDESMIQTIAAESHNSRTERTRVNEKLRSLNAGQDILKRLDQQKEMGTWTASNLSAGRKVDPASDNGGFNPEGKATVEEQSNGNGSGDGPVEIPTNGASMDSSDHPPKEMLANDLSEDWDTALGKEFTFESPPSTIRPVPDNSWLGKSSSKKYSGLKGRNM